MRKRNPNKSDAWDFVSSNLITLSTVVAGILVVVLQQFGLVNATNITTAILAILVLLATSELVDKSKKISNLENLINEGFANTSQALGGCIVRRFTISEEGFEYLAQQLRAAHLNIDHAAFAPPIPRWSEQSLAYEKAMADVLRKSQVRYRYIGGLSDRRHRATRLATVLSDPLIKRFFPRFFEYSEQLPGFSFMLFDEEEVVLYLPSIVGGPETVLAIRNPDVVKQFNDYFTRLWSEAKTLDLETAKQLVIEPDTTMVTRS
jgi:hypothetical protein